MKTYGYNMTPIFDETEAAQIRRINKERIQQSAKEHAEARRKLEDILDAKKHKLSVSDFSW